MPHQYISGNAIIQAFLRICNFASVAWALHIAILGISLLQDAIGDWPKMASVFRLRSKTLYLSAFFEWPLQNISLAHLLHRVGIGLVKNATTNRKTKLMNALEIKGTWNIAKGVLKQKFAQLTDDDLQFAQGKEEELIGRIQRRTGQNKEEIKKVVHRIMDDYCDSRHN